MSRRYIVQLEISPAHGSADDLRRRAEATGVRVLGIVAAEGATLLDCYVALDPREHQLDAHERLKAALFLPSLLSRWLELDGLSWEREIRDA